nr:hypothetical protein [Tanacetum cinerariifolium]
MWNSIQYESYKRPMIPNPDNDQEEILEPLSKMTARNRSQYIVDVKVINYLLQAIPNDIYNLVDACKNAKEVWERTKRLMFGSKVTSHVRHSRLMDEFDKFTSKEGESLESVYERLKTLVNNTDHNNVCPTPVSINTKFLNCLQPEWSKYVIMVRHNQTGDTVSYDVFYDSLVQFEPHVLASKTKKTAKKHDPLSFITHSNASSSQSHANSSYSPQSYYVIHPLSVVDYEDQYQGELQGDSQEDKLKTATIDCHKPRVHDAKYFKEQMLLAMKDEAGSNLNNEDNDFMLDNSYGEETMEEITTAVMLMTRIQLADSNAETVPSYDAKAVSEVNASSKGHEQVRHVKCKTIIQTSDDDQSDYNIIFDDPYMENND